MNSQSPIADSRGPSADSPSPSADGRANAAAAEDDPLAGLSAENREIIVRQARALKAEGRAQKGANADPLPGALLEAYAGLPEAVSGLQVRRIVHYDWVLFRMLKSPVLEALAAAGKQKGPSRTGQESRKQKAPRTVRADYADSQESELIFQLTRPVREMDALMKRGGVEGFRAAAKEAIGYTLGPIEVGILMKCVEREFARYFSTVIKYGPGSKGQEGNGETVFTGPAMMPAPKTGSGGGSTISAG